MGRYVYLILVYMKQWKLEQWMVVWKNIETITPTTRTNGDQRCLSNFSQKLAKRINPLSIGPNFVSTYLTFQLARLLNYEKVGSFSGKITAPMIFGEDALNYYNNRQVDGFWTNHNVRVKVTPAIIEKWVGWNEPDVAVVEGMNVVEQAVHRRALTIPADIRITFCATQTRLFKADDEHCTICEVKEQCRATQKKLFPFLIPKRKTRNA